MTTQTTPERAPSPTTERPLVTVAEASDILGVCRNRVYELIYSGQLASIKMGRSRRIAVAELHRFVAESSVSAA